MKAESWQTVLCYAHTFEVEAMEIEQKICWRQFLWLCWLHGRMSQPFVSYFLDASVKLRSRSSWEIHNEPKLRQKTWNQKSMTESPLCLSGVALLKFLDKSTRVMDFNSKNGTLHPFLDKAAASAMILCHAVGFVPRFVTFAPANLDLHFIKVWFRCVCPHSGVFCWCLLFSIFRKIFSEYSPTLTICSPLIELDEDRPGFGEVSGSLPRC